MKMRIFCKVSIPFLSRSGHWWLLVVVIAHFVLDAIKPFPDAALLPKTAASLLQLLKISFVPSGIFPAIITKYNHKRWIFAFFWIIS
jgi:hypothetical protein